MNRDQKAAAIAEIAANIDESQAVFAVDYRGISVPQVAELRSKLRESDATFKVVKNSLTERAADQVGAETLKTLLEGPTALTFVRGDIATAAKAVADYGRATQLLPFKGGLMDGAALDPDQIRSLSRLPSREVLYGQLVGVVASPVSGLVRTLGALVGGLAVALGQVREKKESGEIPAGEAPAAEATSDAPEPDAPAPQEPAADEQAPAAEAEEKPEGQVPAAEEAAAPEDKAEPEEKPAQEDDNEADVSAETQPEDAETNPTKED
jgi:large subunit ribosomal protein L10